VVFAAIGGVAIAPLIFALQHFIKVATYRHCFVASLGCKALRV